MAATQANQVSCIFRHTPTWVAEAVTAKLSGFPVVRCARHRAPISVSFTAVKTSAKDFIDRLQGPYIGHLEGRGACYAWKESPIEVHYSQECLQLLDVEGAGKHTFICVHHQAVLIQTASGLLKVPLLGGMVLADDQLLSVNLKAASTSSIT
jgi:hypothetical protein